MIPLYFHVTNIRMASVKIFVDSFIIIIVSSYINKICYPGIATQPIEGSLGVFLPVTI